MQKYNNLSPTVKVFGFEVILLKLCKRIASGDLAITEKLLSC